MSAAALYDALLLAVLAEVPPLHAEELRFGRALARGLALPLDVTKAILRELRNDSLILLSPACDLDGMPNGSGWIRTRAGDELYALTIGAHRGIVASAPTSPPPPKPKR